ncbi:MAG TPA: hypothetical protein VKN18_10935 [Blastocatellia bacterium]|nr:hypothetical protein [Blastocatellia bacterium]
MNHASRGVHSVEMIQYLYDNPFSFGLPVGLVHARVALECVCYGHSQLWFVAVRCDGDQNDCELVRLPPAVHYQGGADD